MPTLGKITSEVCAWPPLLDVGVVEVVGDVVCTPPPGPWGERGSAAASLDDAVLRVWPVFGGFRWE